MYSVFGSTRRRASMRGCRYLMNSGRVGWRRSDSSRWMAFRVLRRGHAPFFHRSLYSAASYIWFVIPYATFRAKTRGDLQRSSKESMVQSVQNRRANGLRRFARTGRVTPALSPSGKGAFRMWSSSSLTAVPCVSSCIQRTRSRVSIPAFARSQRKGRSRMRMLCSSCCICAYRNSTGNGMDAESPTGLLCETSCSRMNQRPHP